MGFVLEYSTQEGIWNAVNKGDLAAVKKEIEENGADVFERGAVGETLCHLAFLYRHADMARFFVEKYPTMVNSIYEMEEYHGEWSGMVVLQHTHTHTHTQT